jgi:hypothetical protein
MVGFFGFVRFDAPRATARDGKSDLAMARKTLTMADLIELYTHWYAGRAVKPLARSLGLDPKTVRKYLAPAITAGITPGGQKVAASRWAELVSEWFPSLADGRIHQVTWPEFDKHEQWIGEQLAARVRVSDVKLR